MKRFICKLILFVFPVAVIFLLLNALYVRTNYWKHENNTDKFVNIPYDLELVNLGSSHTCYGLNYDVVPELKAWNLANDSQRYFWDYGVLKNYADHLAENAIVIIPISYFGVIARGDYSEYRKRYYRILPKEDMDYWLLKEYIAYCKLPLLSAGVNRIHIFRDIPKERMTPFYGREKHLDGEDLYTYCVNKHKSWTANNKGEEGYKENREEISRIIDFCYAHHLRPVLITAPITDVLNEIYEADNDFFSTFEQFSNDLCQKYAGLIYLDYSRSEDFSPYHELFADGDHLNNFGAEKFTRTLIKDLQERLKKEKF